MPWGGVAGLALQVTKTGARSWVFRYRHNGRRREAGLGPYPDVLLAKAREYAREARDLLRKGTDLLEERHAAKRQLLSFRQAVDKYDCLTSALMRQNCVFDYRRIDACLHSYKSTWVRE
ncbi:MAG: Arm DNA-binding domain-containing protein [Paracoccaceae bacterium]